jgi:hypothetical protein
LIKEKIMSKLSHQAKVYNALAAAGLNVPVSVESLLAIEGVLPYKLSAYVLYAKIDYGASIAPVRDGRKVIAYQMTDLGNGLPESKATKTPKAVAPKAPKAPKTVVPKTPKTPKVVVPKAPKAPKAVKAPKREITKEMMSDDRIVDVLDDLMDDGDIQYAEDRAYARDYVAVMF